MIKSSISTCLHLLKEETRILIIEKEEEEDKEQEKEEEEEVMVMRAKIVITKFELVKSGK
ncbi:hypothetical protein E2C01_096633 [Portunus trituberculatus]|uniref:Uncharacterized protein n=1 Tax=Portunus trituberculatus TaxID=210409 RepID=A0A5B7K293_PORTR|nr:hypothetical protein [Portunus trituberculatus]